MRYLRFEVSNYKGIKENAVLDFAHKPDSKICTLVGLNESGKTSILEAITLLQSGMHHDDAHKMIHKSKKSNFSGTVSVKATLELDDADELRIKDFCEKEVNFVLSRPIGEIAVTRKFTFQSSKYEGSQTLWTIPLVGKKKRAKTEKKLYDIDRDAWEAVVGYVHDNFPRILFYENFLFEFPDKIYLDSDTAEREGHREYQEIFQDILNSLGNDMSIKEHILERMRSNKEEDKAALEALKGELEQQLSEVILSSWSDVFASSANEIEINFDKDETGEFLKVKVKQGKDRYSIDERSLGFRWFFSFLLFTQFRKERKNEFGETLFLLDEPASNLHPNSQHRLLSVFNKLSQDCRVLYSTHSHHLIDPKNLPCTYIVRNLAINYDDDNASLKDTDVRLCPYRQFAASHPNEKDHFRPVLDALDYAPSGLEFHEDIVCLEGKNDFYTFKLMERLLDRSQAINYYPGAGVDKLDSIFRLYMAWGKRIFAVLDGDKAGQTAQKRYVKELGNYLQDKIITLLDVDSSFKGYTTENLFSAKDQLAITKIAFPEASRYEKSKFNVGIQQLYISGDSIMLTDETKDNFNRVMDVIESFFQG